MHLDERPKLVEELATKHLELEQRRVIERTIEHLDHIALWAAHYKIRPKGDPLHDTDTVGP